jgi:hypothetical protein
VSSRITIKPTPALGFGGLIAIIVGVLMILGGGIAWAMVSQQLASENIYVAKDAPFFADRLVNDPLSAYAQAEAINKHALDGYRSRLRHHRLGITPISWRTTDRDRP